MTLLESKFFSFRINPFKKGVGVQESKQEVIEVPLSKMKTGNDNILSLLCNGQITL